MGALLRLSPVLRKLVGTCYFQELVLSATLVRSASVEASAEQMQLLLKFWDLRKLCLNHIKETELFPGKVFQSLHASRVLVLSGPTWEPAQCSCWIEAHFFPRCHSGLCPNSSGFPGCLDSLLTVVLLMWMGWAAYLGSDSKPTEGTSNLLLMSVVSLEQTLRHWYFLYRQSPLREVKGKSTHFI